MRYCTLCNSLFHQVVINDTKRIDSTWILTGELTERSSLSDDLQQFCNDFPIYLMKKTQNSLAVTGIQEAGKNLRLPVSVAKRGKA